MRVWKQGIHFTYSKVEVCSLLHIHVYGYLKVKSVDIST